MAFRMAIIGLGGMGTWHYKNVTEKIKDIEVVAAYDIREEAKEKILEYGLKLYKSPEELYEDKSIDLVLVATPNDMHITYAIACLKSGKNVISEKPVTLNATELEQIQAVSAETGKFFTVHQNRRWDKDFLTIKKILDDKILSGPYTIESRVQGSRRFMHGWRGHKLNGGGMVLDWGVHLIDQMLYLLPEKLVSVQANLHYVFTPEVDDNFTAMFTFESGLTYLVNIAMNGFITQPRWHMSCTDGTAIIEDWDLHGKVVKLKTEGTLEFGEEIVYTAAGPTRSMAPRPKETTQELELPAVSGEWTEYYENIAQALAGKAKPLVTPAQMLRVMRTIDAIFESSEKKHSVQCNF